jgi:uncharacterized membrane protein YiaA
MRRRHYRAVGVVLLGLGVVIFALGLWGQAPGLRLSGPAVAFMGVVLLARTRRSRS